MAYSAPPTWAHLDRPTAAKLNSYDDGLDAIHILTGDAPYNVATAAIMGNVAHYYIVNRWRWLLYLGAGRILDPAGVAADVSLSSTGGWAAYDLLQVAWMYPGKLYQVQNVTCCFEDATSL
jgi:hypothetical protein